MRYIANSLMITAAIAGLMAGATPRLSAATTPARRATSSVPGQAATTTRSSLDKDKHSCKGKNACKGKGGCKAGDNGCKAKNSCKGKGGCATDGSKPQR